MGRTRRFAARLLLTGALAASAYLAWVSSLGSPAPIDLLPAGAAGVVEVHDAADLAQRLSGTRFAAAFATSDTRAWLERTEAAESFDAVLTEVKRLTGVSLSRRSAFDLVGTAAAAGWYPTDDGAAGAAPWVAAGRLSLRAWAAASAMRFARAFLPGATVVAREEIAGRTIYSFPTGDGQTLHLFLAGRVLLAGSDRTLTLKAARASLDTDLSVTREPSWLLVRPALPAHGEILLWGRDFHAGVPSNARAAVGALLRAGETIEIEVAAEPAQGRPAGGPAEAASAPLPAIALSQQAPLFFFASRDPVPEPLADLLQSRLLSVGLRSGNPPGPVGGIGIGSGYALAIIDGTGGNGLFPAPRGLVVIGMPSAAAASAALPLLFPREARRSSAGGAPALTTRESFPLAGEFELWGAAIGTSLVFATDLALLRSTTADGSSGTSGDPAVAEPGWRVDTVAAISMEKALPPLRRWAAPLSALVTARWPEAPEIHRDIDLLAAVADVRVSAGSDGRRDRAAITLRVRDLR